MIAKRYRTSFFFIYCVYKHFYKPAKNVAISGKFPEIMAKKLPRGHSRWRYWVGVILKTIKSDETPRIPIKIHSKVPEKISDVHTTKIQQPPNSNAAGIPLVVEVCIGGYHIGVQHLV